jgi:putative photosynthetic complex assembly protein 2
MPLLTLFSAILFTVFLWWFTTGLIIAVYGRPRLLTQVGYVVATLAMLLSFVVIVGTRDMTEPIAVIASVTCGVLIWGWLIMAYYLGYITGPGTSLEPALRKQTLLARFTAALQFSLYHEVLAAVCALLICVITWGQPNQWALWIYLALWLMHTSAKLNVFFGVRNFRINLLPEWMHHLHGLLGKRGSTGFFPLSVGLATLALLGLVYHALVTASVGHSLGALIVATMIGLGILEHLLLVLPVASMLWGWGIRAIPPKPQAQPYKENANNATRSAKTAQQVVRERVIKQ